MKILHLLPHTIESGSPVTIKRIIPLTRKLRERGHEIHLQENLAMKEASLEEYRYILARLKYFLRYSLHFSNSYDLIFASKPAMGVLAYLLSKKSAIPFVLELDDLEGIGGLDVFRLGTSLFVRKAARVFVISRELYRLYQKVRSDVVYLPNSADLDFYDPRKYKVTKFDEPTFVWSGKMNWFTNCELILYSISKIDRGRVCIIGDGPKRPYYERLSEKLGLGNRVIFKGWIPDDEVPRLYKASHVGLLPFKDILWARCKAPTRLYEFMAMQLPFICTVGEPAYMAKKLGCGLIAKPSVEDFVQKMEYAINHLDELKDRGRQGRAYLLKEQNYDTITKQLEWELQKAIK